MRFVLALSHLRRHPWLGYATAVAILAAALALRMAFGGLLTATPFVTLFPAVLLAALAGGLAAGILVMVAGALAAALLFMPPDGVAITWPGGVIALSMYFLVSSAQLFVIETLNRAVDELAHERDRSAAMFAEMQHRVANNMAFISSLLRLQSRNVSKRPDTAPGALEDAQRRVETMSRIHRKLYDPAGARLPLSQYFQELCSEILDATGAKNIVCVIEVPAVSFDVTRLMTLSLLVTEIVTNSVKHAFAGKPQGTIAITLDRQAENYLLTVKDDGPGLPADFDLASTHSLGVRIMQGLASQVGGTLTIAGGKGTTAQVTFPA